jgi:hypothetical protein
MTDDLSRIDQAKGFLDATKLSEEWIGAMERRALVREAHFTTHIEGSQLTLDQAERLLAGEILPEVNPEDERELRNYLDAFDFVKQYVIGGAPITERMVLEIHRRLVAGVRGGDLDRDFAQELQGHLDIATEDNIRRNFFEPFYKCETGNFGHASRLPCFNDFFRGFLHGEGGAFPDADHGIRRGLDGLDVIFVDPYDFTVHAFYSDHGTFPSMNAFYSLRTQRNPM